MYFLPSLVCLQLARKRERWLDVSDWSKKSTTYPIGSNHRKNSYRQIHLFLKVTITCVTHIFSCGCCLQLYKSVELLIPLVSFRTLIHSTGCEIYLVGKSYFFISLPTAVASQHSCGGGGCPWPAGWQSCTVTPVGWWLAESLMGEGWGHFLCGGQQTQGWPARGSQHEEIAHWLLPALWWSCVNRSGLKEWRSLDEIKTQKRFKWTLFIRTKWNMQIFTVINPLYQATKRYLTIKRWKMRWRAKPLICF